MNAHRRIRGALVGLLVGTALLGWLAPAIADGVVLAGYALLFGPYLYTLNTLRQLHRRPESQTEAPSGTELLGWLVATALLARLVLVPAAPLLSDDLFRYLWDGRVGMMGINPFDHAPAAAAVATLRTPDIWPHINHPEVPTIYPPGAQYLFEINAWLGGTAVGLKGLFVLVEAACVALAWRVARGAGIGRPQRSFALALYALNPLVFVETAWSGHLDVVAWSLLAVGLLVWVLRRSTASALLAGGLIGASVAVKFLGLVALPFLAVGGLGGWAGKTGSDAVTDGRPWRHRLAALAVVPLIVLGSYVPYLEAGSRLFAGFGTYAEKWRSNDGGFRVTSTIADSALRGWTAQRRAGGEEIEDPQILFRFNKWNATFERLGLTKDWNGHTVPDTTYTAEQLAGALGKAIAVLLVALALMWALLTRAGPIAGTSLILVTLFLFAPVVHPWYVAWLVPLATLRPDACARTALTFSAAVLLAYLAWWRARAGGEWYVPHWAIALEYGAVLLAATWDTLMGRNADGEKR